LERVTFGSDRDAMKVNGRIMCVCLVYIVVGALEHVYERKVVYFWSDGKRCLLEMYQYTHFETTF
jgi:hypothetical protein